MIDTQRILSLSPQTLMSSRKPVIQKVTISFFFFPDFVDPLVTYTMRVIMAEKTKVS